MARQLLAVSVGAAHAGWRLWRRRFTHQAVAAPPVAATAAAPGATQPGPDEQTEASGVGPRFRRRFRVTVHHPERSAEAVMAAAQADPNRIAPRGFAGFFKQVGASGTMAVGDEYLIDLLGPWTNRVRVVDTTPTSFRLATLDGHVEAGHVDIAVTDDGDDTLTVQVTARTRSKDRTLDMLYDRLGLVRLLQTEMWAQVCEHGAAQAGGQADPLRIDDLRLPDPDDPART